MAHTLADNTTFLDDPYHGFSLRQLHATDVSSRSADGNVSEISGWGTGWSSLTENSTEYLHVTKRDIISTCKISPI